MSSGFIVKFVEHPFDTVKAPRLPVRGLCYAG